MEMENGNNNLYFNIQEGIQMQMTVPMMMNYDYFNVINSPAVQEIGSIIPQYHFQPVQYPLQTNTEMTYVPPIETVQVIETIAQERKPVEAMKQKTKRQIENSIHYSNHRNYQCFQQAILITLINNYADITVKRERKRSNTTVPFFTISNITFNKKDIIDFEIYIQKRCIEIKEYDLNHNVNMKTATRRYKTNRITEVIHTLIDILKIKNEKIETTKTRYKEGIKQSETMIGCEISGRMMKEYDIKKYGEEINMYLKNMINNDEIKIMKGDLYEKLKYSYLNNISFLVEDDD